MTILNTHTAVKQLIHSGFTEQQAEDLIEVFNNLNTGFVKKEDINKAINDFEFDLRDLKFDLKSQISNFRNDLRGEIKTINNSLKWIMAILMVIIGILLQNVLFLK